MSVPRIRPAVIAGLTCAAVLTGCTNGGVSRQALTAQALTAQTLPARTTTSPAPVSSLGFIDCGTFVYAQGEQRSPATAQCIVAAAHSGRVARLIETSPTTEGDPVVTKYATNERGRLAVLTDSRQDRFGSPNLDLQTYRTAQQDGRAVLVKDRIGQAQLWPPRRAVISFRELGILRPLLVERDCGFTSFLAERPELTDLPLTTVEETERAAGRSVRVIGQDGSCNSGTYDLRYSRTNVYVRKGRVVWAQMA